MLGTKEHDDLMKMFERIFRHFRLDKEGEDLWSKGRIYQDGQANELFLAFRHGYAYGKAEFRGN